MTTGGTLLIYDYSTVLFNMGSIDLCKVGEPSKGQGQRLPLKWKVKVNADSTRAGSAWQSSTLCWTDFHGSPTQALRKSKTAEKAPKKSTPLVAFPYLLGLPSFPFPGTSH